MADKVNHRMAVVRVAGIEPATPAFGGRGFRISPTILALVEAGAAARKSGMPGERNPHLAELTQAIDGTPGMSAAFERCDAWWDGWAEVDRVLASPTLVRGGRFGFHS